MALDPVTAILNIGNTILDRVLPDKQQNDAAKAQLLTLQLSGDITQALSQNAVNQAEAANNSVFVAGWRPYVGWICGSAFAYAYIVQPFLQFILVACKVNLDLSKLPVVSMAEISPVLLGMLGLGAMRSYDKTQGTGNGH